ncbi:MAG: aminomethyl-transferring glycine dehydrogenase subunit GcvPA, partial [Muribaculaceae bacterium]|nr:aminomethyl-transferring glycine dehydrogenase subunit GcvPA [Muribaculaceae bacterium]
MHPFLPHTESDIAAMLSRCGVGSLDDLYADVPASLRLKQQYSLPKAMSEPELERFFAEIAADNHKRIIFAGGGFYNHYTPAAVTALASRSEFLTAYTPYQPEISQGTLQYIFEYQSMMCSLTGLDVSNASMYDGSTATAEAMMMAVAASRKKRRVLISATVAPAVAQVVETYASPAGITLEVIPEHRGSTDRQALADMLGAGDVAGVIVASPNYYGVVEDFSGFADMCHAAKALLIVNSHASALGVLRTPAEWGADIACGEAQSLGMPLNYGGPGLGYLCCTKALMRKMPGRIVGATVDSEGRRSFVLTLQAREQHIRRQKATSNICSNQGIMTLHAAAYLSLMGAAGLRKVNELSFKAAHTLAEALLK